MARQLSGRHRGRGEVRGQHDRQYPGQRITVHEGDLARQRQRVLGEVINQHGRLDVLVNNAGITINRTVAKMTDEDWQKVIAVDTCSGAFFMAQAALEHMLERGTGRVISMSSAVGKPFGSIGQANYAASKSGLFGLTKSLAKEAISTTSAARRWDRADRQRGHPRLHRHRHAGHDPRQGDGPDSRPDPGGAARAAGGDRPGGRLPGAGRPMSRLIYGQISAVKAAWICERRSHGRSQGSPGPVRRADPDRQVRRRPRRPGPVILPRRWCARRSAGRV